jgi:hypothetical protein
MGRGERNDPELDSLDDGDERLSKEQWRARAIAAEERAAAAETLLREVLAEPDGLRRTARIRAHFATQGERSRGGGG